MTRLFEHATYDLALAEYHRGSMIAEGIRSANALESNHFSPVVKGRMTLPHRAHCEERKVPRTRQRRFHRAYTRMPR